jgi:hypothetical protein
MLSPLEITLWYLLSWYHITDEHFNSFPGNISPVFLAGRNSKEYLRE